MGVFYEANRQKLKYYDDNKILNEVTKYLDYLETPNENFGGMAVCPFLKKERVTEGLMLRVWRPNEESFFSVLDEFVESDKTSALLVCMDSDGIMWEEINRKKYQKTTNYSTLTRYFIYT